MREVLTKAADWDVLPEKEQIHMLAPAMLCQVVIQFMYGLGWIVFGAWLAYLVRCDNPWPSIGDKLPSGPKFIFLALVVISAWITIGIVLLIFLDSLSRKCCLMPHLRRDAFTMWYYRRKLIRRPFQDRDDLDSEDE